MSDSDYQVNQVDLNPTRQPVLSTLSLHLVYIYLFLKKKNVCPHLIKSDFAWSLDILLSLPFQQLEFEDAAQFFSLIPKGSPCCYWASNVDPPIASQLLIEPDASDMVQFLIDLAVVVASPMIFV